MAWIKKSFYLATIPLSVGLSIMSAVSLQVQAEPQPEFSSIQNIRTFKISQTFKTPNRGTPRSTTGGATRGSSNGEQHPQIISLIPKQKFGLTFSERPKFFWYISESTSQNAEFLLLDRNDNLVYETRFPLPKKAGIFAFTLPDNAPTLKVSNQYHWYLSVNSNSDQIDDTVNLEGWVERIKPDINLQIKLSKLKPQYQSEVYAEAGIWYDALANLVQQRCTYPNDSKIMLNWSKFLTSVGLKDLASKPLNDVCKVGSSKHSP
jgi:Domain of Unknown Function (DUF928)